MKYYEKYFDVKRTPKRGIRVTPKNDAINEAKRYYGFFALVSNEKMEAVTALEVYRARDVVEKAFGNLKDRLNGNRTFVSSEQTLDGKMFVEFVALIYLSYINKCIQEQSLYGKYTMEQLLDKLDIIECFEYPGEKMRVKEVLQKQHDLFVALGVEPLQMR